MSEDILKLIVAFEGEEKADEKPQICLSSKLPRFATSATGAPAFSAFLSKDFLPRLFTSFNVLTPSSFIFNYDKFSRTHSDFVAPAPY